MIRGKEKNMTDYVMEMHVLQILIETLDRDQEEQKKEKDRLCRYGEAMKKSERKEKC